MSRASEEKDGPLKKKELNMAYLEKVATFEARLDEISAKIVSLFHGLLTFVSNKINTIVSWDTLKHTKRTKCN